jgi:hypothetical protein
VKLGIILFYFLPRNSPINPINPFIGDLRYFFATDKLNPGGHTAVGPIRA